MARSELTLGFVRTGKVEKRNAYALLRDLIDAEGGNAKFILPMTKAFWNPALEVVSSFAVDNGVPVEAVVDDSTAKVKELKALLGGARRQHQSTAVAHKLASLLEEARNGKLIVLWDDEDEAGLDAVREADAKGIALLELTRGLDRIELVTGDEEADEPVSDEIPEAEIVAENDLNEAENAGQPAPEDEIPAEEEENGDEDDESSDFPEPEAEDDLDSDEDEDEADEDGELPEDEEFSLPEEDDTDVAVLDMEQDIVEEVRQVTGMSEFQRRLLAVLEKASEAFVAAVEAIMAEAQPAPKAAMAVESKPAAAKATAPKRAPAAKKVAPPVKKTAPPAKKATPAKRAAPAKKATPAPAETNGGGTMSRAEAQRVIDQYRPRRGRPPSEVTEARRILGLA
jgi:hypothetical protein